MERLAQEAASLKPLSFVHFRTDEGLPYVNVKLTCHKDNQTVAQQFPVLLVKDQLPNSASYLIVGQLGYMDSCNITN